MKLKDYIKFREMSVRAAARDGGFPEENFRLWSLGRSVPRAECMLKLFKWSNGHVTPNDFYNLQADGVSPSEQSPAVPGNTAVSPATGVQVRDSLRPGHGYDLAGVA